MDPVILMMLEFLVIRLVCVIVLLYEWFVTKKRNIGLLFANNFFFLLGYIVKLFDFLFYFFLFENIAVVLWIWFVKNTFNYSRKKTALILTIISIILILIQMPFFYNASILPIAERQSLNSWGFLFHGIVVILCGSWFFFSAIRAYSLIKKDSMIEKWVKWRYKLIILYTLLYCSIGVLFPFMVRNPDLTINWAYSVINLIVVVGTILEFICWAMPSLIQRIFFKNKVFEASEVHDLIDEKKIMEELKK